MAEVYLAKLQTIEGFEKTFALKKIHKHLAHSQDFAQMFVHEARISGTLDHGNIVRVTELNQDKGTYFIVMEYVDGVDLQTLLDFVASLKRTIPWDLAVFVVMEVCRGLEYAHSNTDEDGMPMGIVHRDLSPANVMISQHGEVKVLDFGIARALLSDEKSRQSTMKGKYAYMSPEQVRSDELDGRSDIFALGAMFYEMLTGKRLFEGTTAMETIRRVEKVELPARFGVEPALEPVLRKMLARNPSARFTTARELMTVLSQKLVARRVSVTQSDLASYLAGARLRAERIRKKEEKEAAKKPPEEIGIPTVGSKPSALPSDPSDKSAAGRRSTLKEELGPASKVGPPPIPAGAKAAAGARGAPAPPDESRPKPAAPVPLVSEEELERGAPKEPETAGPDERKGLGVEDDVAEAPPPVPEEFAEEVATEVYPDGEPLASIDDFDDYEQTIVDPNLGSSDDQSSPSKGGSAAKTAAPPQKSSINLPKLGSPQTGAAAPGGFPSLHEEKTRTLGDEDEAGLAALLNKKRSSGKSVKIAVIVGVVALVAFLVAAGWLYLAPPTSETSDQAAGAQDAEGISASNGPANENSAGPETRRRFRVAPIKSSGEERGSSDTTDATADEDIETPGADKGLPSTTEMSGSPPPGAVDLVTEPAGASVVVGGRVLGKTPTRLRLKPKKPYVVALNKEGRGVEVRRITLGADKGRRLKVELPPVKKPARRARTGHTAVMVSCTPKGIRRVYLNGWDTGLNCPVALEVGPGKNNVGYRSGDSVKNMTYKDFMVRTGKLKEIEIEVSSD
jgi:serine/threonine-protein kinase